MQPFPPFCHVLKVEAALGLAQGAGNAYTRVVMRPNLPAAALYLPISIRFAGARIEHFRIRWQRPRALKRHSPRARVYLTVRQTTLCRYISIFPPVRPVRLRRPSS